MIGIIGTVYAISISLQRGQLKKEVPEANVIEGYGIENDGHGGPWGRQITCLSWASVQKAKEEHHLNVGPGDFAENLLIDGLDLRGLKVGDRLKLGETVLLEITQIGKEDHPSVVSKTFGVSLLPGEGLFCKVIAGGRLKKGDPVALIRY